jgi:hypothetical protein
MGLAREISIQKLFEWIFAPMFVQREQLVNELPINTQCAVQKALISSNGSNSLTGLAGCNVNTCCKH